MKTQADLQISAPGLVVRSTQGSNDLSFAIRGQVQDASANTQPSVLTYVDEVHVDTTSSSALYDLQSVQVLKGPQGTLFGRNYTGGAVLFTTARPTNQFGGYIQTRAGDYGLTSTEGAINLPIVSDKVLLRVPGFYENRNGISTNLYDGAHLGRILDAAGRATLTINATNDLHNSTVVDYFHGGGTSLPGIPYSVYAPGSTNGTSALNGTAALLFSPSLDSITFPGAFADYLAAHPNAYPGGFLAFSELQKQRGALLIDVGSSQAHKADNLLISNITTYNLNIDLQVKNVFGFGRAITDDQIELSGSPYTIISATNGGKFGQDNTNYSEELQLLGKAFLENLSYVNGFFYSHSAAYTDSDATEVDVTPIIPATHIQHGGVDGDLSYARYAQGTCHLTPWTRIAGLGVTASFRYTDETVYENVDRNSAFLNYPGGFNHLSSEVGKFSWQFGIQEQLNQGLLLYAVSRHSFRSGGYNIATPPTAGTAANNGPAYNPETATDVEVGMKYGGRVGSIPYRINVAGYREWIKGVQRSDIITVFTQKTALTVNVPEAEVTGFEVDGQVNPIQWLALGATLPSPTGSSPRERRTFSEMSPCSVPTPIRQKVTGAAFAEATFPISDRIGTFSVRGDMYAQSSNIFSSFCSTITPGTKIPGYFLENFRVALSNIGGRLITLAAYLKNASNQVYYTGGQPVGNTIWLNTVEPGDPRSYFFELTCKF